MQDHAGFVLGVEALVRVALVVVELVGDGYLWIQSTGQDYFEQVQLTQRELLTE